MKKITYLLYAVTAFFTTFTLSAAAQSEETRKVPGFNCITSEGPFNVQVKIGNSQSLRIATSADVIKLIETVVKNDTLKIRFKDDLKPGQGNTAEAINIYVSAKSLTAIEKDGAGSITVDGTVVGKDLSMSVKGSGNIRASVKSENLLATVNGSGTIRLGGDANDTKVAVSGPGVIDGSSLKTNDAAATINGSGSVSFQAEQTIYADITGSGSVNYSGHATIAESKTVGSGKIVKTN
ncbi:MAG: DUF2807 domain-containing protein [Sphingobacteriaceae bacterium]|nr:MAG: DUF2807 domain-containing protein [Sphingobacteriaceae bacterium]